MPVDDDWSVALRIEFPGLVVREPIVARLGFEEDNLVAPKAWAGSQINATVYSSRGPSNEVPPFPFQFGVGPFRRRDGGCFWVMVEEVESTPERIELAKDLILGFAGAHAAPMEVIAELPPVYKIFSPEQEPLPTIIMPPVDYSIIRVPGDLEYEEFLQRRIRALKELWGRPAD